MKRTTSYQISKIALNNPFLAYGKNVNLNQMNPGVSWSICDPNNVLAKT